MTTTTMDKRCDWMIDRSSTGARRMPRRCNRPATTTVLEYGRNERDYCDRHAPLAVRDFDGAIKEETR